MHPLVQPLIAQSYDCFVFLKVALVWKEIKIRKKKKSVMKNNFDS